MLILARLWSQSSTQRGSSHTWEFVTFFYFLNIYLLRRKVWVWALVGIELVSL